MRNFQHLKDAGLVFEGKGIVALKQAAITGAGMRAGMALVQAARVAFAIKGAHANWVDGYVPGGLGKLEIRVPDPLPSLDKEANDYWLHRWVMENEATAASYPKGEALRSDQFITVYDREFVCIGHRNEFPSDPAADYVGRFIDFDGPSIRFVGWSDEYTLEEIEAAAPDIGKRIRNSVSQLMINGSLAIRNALDAVFEHRANRLRQPAEAN